MTDFDYFDFQTADSFLEGISMGENIDKNVPEWDLYPNIPMPLTNARMMSIPSNMSSNSSNESPLESSTHTSPEVKDEEYKPKMGKVTKPKSKDKTSHNMIEKKYRTNINSKILALRDAVPSLRIAAGSKDISIADLEGLTPASKLNKASVLTKATEYIKHLEKKNELLQRQNAHLRTMIEGANTHQVPPAIPPQQSFGYYPQEQSYNATPVQQSYSGSSQYTPDSQSSVSYTQENMQNNDNLLLGGMATMMATTLFAGPSDYKGMSIIPIVPLWKLAQVVMILIVATKIAKDNAKRFKTKKGEWNLNVPADDSKRAEILDQLLGKRPVAFTSLLSSFFVLRNSEPSFENVFLSVLVGKLTMRKWPSTSLFLAHRVAQQMVLLKNVEYRGENKPLQTLSSMLNTLGLDALSSETVMTRVTNMASSVPINQGIIGPNGVKYVEVKMENTDFYAIFTQWHLLELLDNAVRAVLVEVSGDADEHPIVDVDLEQVAWLVPQKGTVTEYCRLVQSVVDSDHAPQLLRDIEVRVKRSLTNFGALVNPEVSEEEWIDDDETEVSSDNEECEKSESPIGSKLVGSLNLVSEEEFVVLTSSLAVYFYNQGLFTESSKLVGRLSLANKQLSMVAFTSVVKMVGELVPEVEVDAMDGVILKCRGWLEEVKMDFEIKARLTKMMVDKGKIVGGIE